MKTLMKVGVLATALVALAACAPPAPDTTAEAASIMKDSMAWWEHYNAGDADAVAALYAEDAVLLAPGSPKVVGRAAIRDWLAKDIASSQAAGISDAGSPVTDGAVDGNTGWITGEFMLTAASGEKVGTGKYVTVYRRIDGKWMIVRDTWNMDSEPDTGSSVVLTARVENSARWEEGFRTHADLFKSQTVRSPIRFTANNLNEVAISMQMDDLDKYLSVMDSQATAEAMAFDGVKRDTVKIYVLDKKFDLD